MSNENPLRNNALTPQRLVMVRNECFYCGHIEDVKQTMIEHLFGIRHCSHHSILAYRDCKAYLHENKLVDINDIKNEEPYKRFVNVFKDKKFSIIRSNGNVDDGWQLKEDSFIDKAFLSCKDGYWYISLCKYAGKDIITKGFKISDFNDERLMKLNKDIYPANFIDLQKDLMHFLEKGVYKRFYESHKNVMNQDNDNTVLDEPFIKKVTFNGKQVRVAVFDK